MKNNAIFGDMDARRLFVISASKPRNFDLCCECCAFLVQSEEMLCLRGAVFGDLSACGVFARAAFSCIGRGPVPVIRKLHLRCACVCAVSFLRAVD